MEGTALEPISADAPCGPDLDQEGDADFLNFMAATEGQLPASFFSFDRKTIDFPAAFAAAEPLLKRTQDVRLYALLAKLAILNRDLAGFAKWMATIASLLEVRWDDVHPRGEDGDFGARVRVELEECLYQCITGRSVDSVTRLRTVQDDRRDIAILIDPYMFCAHLCLPNFCESLSWSAAAGQPVAASCVWKAWILEESGLNRPHPTCRSKGAP